MKIFSPIVFALFLLCLPASALAQELEVDPGDLQVTIKGWIGDEVSFAGDVRVILRNVPQGTTAPKLSVLPSHLKGADGEQIGRQQVQVSTELVLTPELFTNVPIKITGVKSKGEYKGKIELLLAGQPRDKAKTVELTVIAGVRPALTLLTDRVKANIVNCEAPCTLGQRLVPTAGNKYELRFEKPVGAPLVIPDRSFDIKGEKTGVQLNLDQLKFGPPTWSATALPSPTAAPSTSPSASPTEPAQPSTQPIESAVEKRFITLPVELAYSSLPADHYVGTIYLSIDGQAAPIKVPVDVSVRVAPLWPLLFLAGGIVLGKLAKYMQERGAPAADALVAYNRVELHMGEADEKDQGILRPQLAEARTLINEDQAAPATARLKLIDARLATLKELRAIEWRLAGKEQNPKVKEVLDAIPPVRELIRQGDDEEVKKRVVDIQTNLVALSISLMGGGAPDPSVEAARASAQTAAAAAEVSATTVPPKPPVKQPWFRRFLARLSGMSDEVRTEATFWLLRPLLWLVLIISLIALGMKSLYIDNPIFGASSFDYISLVFWGLSSDVASRTIGSLKIGGAGGAQESPSQ